MVVCAITINSSETNWCNYYFTCSLPSSSLLPPQTSRSDCFAEREYEVWRRYKDFEWLREQLSLTYPTHIIPVRGGRRKDVVVPPYVLPKNYISLKILVSSSVSANRYIVLPARNFCLPLGK